MEKTNVSEKLHKVFDAATHATIASRQLDTVARGMILGMTNRDTHNVGAAIGRAIDEALK